MTLLGKRLIAAAKEANGTASVPWVARKPPTVRKRKPAAPPGIPEWLLQSYLMAEFNLLESQGWPLAAEGDMNAGKRGRWAAAQAKAMGLRAGTADVRLYGDNGRLLPIEVKTTTGKMSLAQTAWHERMGQLGFLVLVVTPKDEQDARRIAREIATKFCDPAGGLL